MRILLQWLMPLLLIQLPSASCSKRERDGTKTLSSQIDTTAAVAKSSRKIKPDSLAKRAIVIYTKRDTSDNLIVYGLNWPANERAELGVIPKQFSRRFSRLQVSPTGKIAYIIRDSLKYEHLVMSDDNMTITLPAQPQKRLSGYGRIEDKQNFHFEESRNFPDYALSPGGETLIFCADLETATWDSSVNVFVHESRIFTLSFGDTVYQNVRSDTLLIASFFDDTDYSRGILGWSYLNPNCILLGNFISGQLDHRCENPLHYDFIKQEYTGVDSLVEIYFSMSHDENRILYANNDGTCCGNINGENNLLLSYDRTSGAVDTLFNEYQAFNNEKKAEEHVPHYAEFSPDLRFVAFNLEEMVVTNAASDTASNKSDSLPGGDTYNPMGGYAFRVIKLEDRSETEFSDRKFYGWLDTENILVQNCKRYWAKNRWDERLGPVCVISINTGEEKVLLQENEKLLKIAWF